MVSSIEVDVVNAPPAPTLVIYGDFNCPFSALANARATRLIDAGTIHVDWRCVEHDPTIGPRETPLTADQRAGFEAELAQIRELLGGDEPDRFRLPSRRLNTRDLNQVYAAAAPAHRSRLRSAFFDAYWHDDLDLTDDDVVAAIVTATLPDRSHDSERRPTTTAEHLVAAWQREWLDLPRPIVPSMVLPHGGVSRGLGVLARLIDGSVAASTP